MRKHQRMFDQRKQKTVCALCAREPSDPSWADECPGPRIEAQTQAAWIEEQLRARRAPELLQDFVCPVENPDYFGPAELLRYRYALRQILPPRVAGICLSTFAPASDQNWHPACHWDGTIWNPWSNDTANYPHLWAGHAAMQKRAQRARDAGYCLVLPCVWVCAQHAHTPLPKYMTQGYDFPGSPRGLSRRT